MKLIFITLLLAGAMWLGAKAGHLLDRHLKPRVIAEEVAQ